MKKHIKFPFNSRAFIYGAKWLVVITILTMTTEIFSFFILRYRDQAPNGFYQPTPVGKGIRQSDSEGDILPLKPRTDIDWIAPEFKISVHINADRIRDLEGKSVSQADYLFLGDSFTFGHGVERSDRFSSVFERGVPFEESKFIVNAAYRAGFQPQHYLAFLQRSDARPKNVIVGLYLGNDFGSDLQETVVDPHSGSIHLPWRWVDDLGAMRNSPSVYHTPLDACVSYSNFCELLVRVLQKTDLRSFIVRVPVNQPNSVALELGLTKIESNESFKALLSLRQRVESWGGRFLVCIIPQNFYVASPSEAITNPHIHPSLRAKLSEVRGGPNLLKQTRQALDEAGIKYVDASTVLHLEDYFEIDSHWNSRGHAKVGELIMRNLVTF